MEGAPPYKPASRDKYSNRVSAINRQSINLLRSVGAWEHVESVRCKPVKQMQVWDAISGELIEFSHPNFSDSVACIVENDLILEGLHKQLNTIENVCIKNSSSLISCELVKDGFDRNNVILKTGEKITCDLLVSICTLFMHSYILFQDFKSLFNMLKNLKISSTLFDNSLTFVFISLT